MRKDEDELPLEGEIRYDDRIMMATLVPAVLIFFHSGQQLTRVSPIPMIRFTGREGAQEDGLKIKDKLKDIPYDPPNPQILPDNSIAFVEKDRLFAVFDSTFRPLRAIIAKNELVDLILENGPQAAFRISKLPYSLYDDLIETFDNTIPSYVATQSSTMTISLNLQTSLKLPTQNFNFGMSPNLSASEFSKVANDLRDKNPMIRDDAHAQYVNDREFKYSKLPIVKIFSNGRVKPKEFSDYEKRAARLFEDWAQKENFNIDQKLFNGLERMNVWSDKAAIFRTKVMSDLQSTSPGAYKDLMSSITKDYQKFGFNNEDAFREALSSASTNSTMSFTITLMLSDKQTLTTVNYPF